MEAEETRCDDKGSEPSGTNRVQAIMTPGDYVRNIIDTSLDMIITVDTERRIVEFNRAAEGTFGYSRREVFGQRIDMLYADPHESDKVHTAVHTNGQFVGEAHNRRSNGETFRSFISSTLLRDASGRVIGNMGISRDIEKEKQIQEAIRISKQEWESTFDAITDWVCLIDLDFTIVRSNRRGEAYAGMSVKRLVGRKCCRTLHGTDTPVENCPVPAMLATGQRASVETQLPDGRWVLVTVDPVIGPAGTPVSAVHIVRDITARKRHEAERDRLLTELQRALTEVKKLSGMLPICAECKKIRDDKGYWNQIESYIRDHSEARFSHGICPDCAHRLYPGFRIGDDSQS